MLKMLDGMVEAGYLIELSKVWNLVIENLILAEENPGIVHN